MTEKEDPAFIERFTVRMPDGMRDAVAARAKANGRSMNSEIVQILQDALDSQTSVPKAFPEGVSKEDDFNRMVKFVNDKTEDFKNNLLSEILEYAAFHPNQPPSKAQKMRQGAKNQKNHLSGLEKEDFTPL